MPDADSGASTCRYSDRTLLTISGKDEHFDDGLVEFGKTGAGS